MFNHFQFICVLDCKLVGKGLLKRAIHVHQAEAWALLEAMHMANTYDWSEVIFETDNANISSYIENHSTLPPWQSVPILKKCVNLCYINAVWSCVFVYRECNEAADALAKAARKNNLCGEWWSHPPELLISHITSDATSVPV